MALTREGYVPEKYEDISSRISSKLEAVVDGIDLSLESPDGALVDIVAFELSVAYSELNTLSTSYDPNRATGYGLRNLGQITGIEFGVATKSQASIDLIGVVGTIVPAGSEVVDPDGNVFSTEFDASIPATVQAIAKVSGPIPVPVGTLSTIKTPVNGWTTVDQPLAGRVGSPAQTETQFRNTRNATVLNNDSSTVTLPDGTPPLTIHVTVGPVAGITDEAIARTILLTKSLGVPTFGTTTVTVKDEQGHDHDISFSKATAVSIYMDLDVTYLDPNFAGATEAIKADLITHVLSLLTGESVVWSRLFTFITPHGKAQINSLKIGKTVSPANSVNVPILDAEFAYTEDSFINVVVT